MHFFKHKLDHISTEKLVILFLIPFLSKEPMMLFLFLQLSNFGFEQTTLNNLVTFIWQKIYYMILGKYFSCGRNVGNVQTIGAGRTLHTDLSAIFGIHHHDNT